MPELTIVIREADEATLKSTADRDWRTPEQQASALLEQTLAAQRARLNAPDRPAGRRGPRGSQAG